MNGHRRRAVFICPYHEPLRSTLLPVCRALLAAGEVSPVVVLEGDPGDRMQAMCQAADVEFHLASRKRSRRTSAGPDRQQVSEGSTAASPPKRIGGLKWLVRAGSALAEIPVKVLRKRTWLDRLRADVLVVLDDRTLVGAPWVHAAHQRGIPAVTMQWAAFHRESTVIELRAAQTASKVLSPVARWAQRHIAGRIPRAARPHPRDDALLWLIVPDKSIGLWTCGAFPKYNPWAFGGGNSDLVTVFGEAWKQRIVEDGVPGGRLRVTGHPDQDAWFRTAQSWSPQRACRVREMLGVASHRRLVTLIAPALQLRGRGQSREGDVPLQDLRRDLRAVVDSIRRLGPEFLPAVKVHPRDTQDDLAFLRSGTDLPIVRDLPLDELIAASEAMACQWSSAAMIGHAVDTPVLVFDFHNSPSSDLWRDAPGLPPSTSGESFDRRLRSVFNDPAMRLQWQTARGQFVQRYLRLDGQANRPTHGIGPRLCMRRLHTEHPRGGVTIGRDAHYRDSLD